MNIAGIVAEYNPFHNGHAYQIDQTKKAGASHIIACMSGNFTQRGEAAIFNKFSRAKTAILNGVDLVLELPVCYSLSSAEYFCFGAISILNSLGCVNTLSFGSESGNISELQKAVDAIENIAVQNRIKNYMKISGESYASARSHELDILAPNVSNILKKPNNTLGVEYLKWLKRLNSNMIPITITRYGTQHDSNTPSEQNASASYIRNNMHSNWEDVSQFIPESALQILDLQKNSGKIINPVKLEIAILSRLRGINKSKLQEISDVKEGLENRIYSAINEATSLNQLYDLIKTKRYTMSRIRRIVLNSFLDIPEYLRKKEPPYIRVLAFNKKGQEILKLAKKTSSMPISTSLANIRNISKESLEYIDLEARSTDLYNLCTNIPEKCGEDFTRKIELTNNL